MARLSLSLLGPFQATLDGEPMAGLGAAKVRALLAYLAVEALQRPGGRPHPHPRIAVAELLWSERSGRVALANLRNALSSLRQAIGDRSTPDSRDTSETETESPPFLLVTRETIQFNPDSDYWLDVDAFQALVEATTGDGLVCERLEEAVALYRGDFLEGFSGRGRPGFEDWSFLVREKLQRQALDALRRLAAHYEGRGAIARACEVAWRQVELAPWEEETHRQLMRLLALNGQRGAALAQYEACRRALREELDVAPGEETTQLYEWIRDGTGLPGPTRPGRSGWRSNLPVQSTPFVGREVQLAEIRALLARPEVRLLTLTGAGGTGKTRLALQVASGLVEDYAGGVVFVPLASMRDPVLVPSAIAVALGVQEPADGTLLDAIKYVLRESQSLLLIDNFEHLVGAAAVVSALLASAPDLTVLVTSRVPLHLYAEHVYAVPPMVLPGAEDLPPLERLAQVETVRLFVERARRAKPDFVLCEENARAIAEICARLDGLPLAIELAAARVGLLSPQAMLPHLDDALRFLTGGPRDVPARQRTLRATIDWSYDLLDDRERALLRRLAVFAGGCDLDAVKAVCLAAWPTGVSPPTLDLLGALVEQSLLQVQEVEGAPRFVMLEMVRAYALEQLEACRGDEVRAAHERHARHYMALAESIEPRLPTQGTVRAKELDRELDNLRAALSWSIAHAPVVGVRLAGALAWFWESYAYVSEGRAWLEKALAVSRARGIADRWYAKVLAWSGWLAVRQGDREGVALIAESVALWRKLREPRRLSFAMIGLAMAVSSTELARARMIAADTIELLRDVGDQGLLAIAYAEDAAFAARAGALAHAAASIRTSLDLVRQVEGTSAPFLAWPRRVYGLLAQGCGDYAGAREWFAQALAIHRSVEHKPGIAHLLTNLGECWYMEGNAVRARACYRESLALERAAGRRGAVASILVGLGHAALCEQRWEEARSHLKEALALSEEMGSLRSGRVAGALVGCARLAATQGQMVHGARLLGAAEALLASWGWVMHPLSAPQRDRAAAALRAALGEEGFAAAWGEGETVARVEGAEEQIVADALGTGEEALNH